MLAGNLLRRGYGNGQCKRGRERREEPVRQLGGRLGGHLGGRYYRVAGIGCDTLRFKLASGEIDADGLAAASLDVDVASGQVRAEGSFSERVSTKTASGQLDVVCQGVAPRQVDSDLASGQVSVALPADTGFTAKVSKASGSFSSAFETMQQGGSYVHGDGSTAIKVHLASGDFKVEKA